MLKISEPENSGTVSTKHSVCTVYQPIYLHLNKSMKVTSEKDACKLSLSTCAGKRSISDSSEEESDTRTIIFDMEDIVYSRLRSEHAQCTKSCPGFVSFPGSISAFITWSACGVYLNAPLRRRDRSSERSIERSNKRYFEPSLDTSNHR